MLTTAILLIILGSSLTAWGGYIISNMGTKDLMEKISAQSHPIPSVLYSDLHFKVKNNSFIQDSILDKAYEKIHVPLGNPRELTNLHLSVFFDEMLFNKNKQLEKNFDIFPEIIDSLKTIKIHGYIRTKNKSIKFESKPNIKITEKQNIDDYSNIEVRNFDMGQDGLNFYISNLELSINVSANSENMSDFENADIKFAMISPKDIKPDNISGMTIKTKRTNYFRVVDITKGDLGFYNGVLKKILE